MAAGQAQLWTAILLAGQRPGPDPLARFFNQRYKALIPVHGATMLERVAKCLLRVPQIGRVIILAQQPELLIRESGNRLGADPRVLGFVSHAGIAESIGAVLRSPSCRWPVLVTTADHALLTPEIVEEFLAGAEEGDLSIGAVERETVLRRYPETARTWLKFADGAYSGANLFALRNERVASALELWRNAERDRKQAFRLFWHFGPLLALRAILRLIGFRDAIAQAGQRLGVDARLVELSAPEAAIDVDKLSDYSLVSDILARRSTLVGAPAARTPIPEPYDADRAADLPR